MRDAHGLGIMGTVPKDGWAHTASVRRICE